MRQIVHFAKAASMAAVLSATAAAVLSAQTFTTLYSFDGKGDGQYPWAGLVQAQNGELYGANGLGGANIVGTLFKITTNGTLTTLYDFCAQSGCTDGASPEAAPIQDPNGELYGTTSDGGAYKFGTVFKITPDGALTTVYTFCAQSGCPDGAVPYGGIVRAPDGAFYGTTIMGGVYGTVGGLGSGGTVFKITPDGTLTTLYNFCAESNCADGNQPYTALVRASNGEFYGTTYTGGAYNQGTIFKITAGGTLTTLYSFCAQSGCPDGSLPSAALVQSANGDLFGTTYSGGADNDGTIFRITRGGTLTNLYSLCAKCPVGANPTGNLIQATDGALYGTTSAGGDHRGGAIFKIAPDGALTALYSFCSQSKCADGLTPQAGLVQDTDGVLYGTTFMGGAYNYGTVFSLSVGLGPFVEPQTTSGKVGATVKILGTGLTGATGVTFNGTAAGFTINGRAPPSWPRCRPVPRAELSKS
jgi:uncharacterized repeat protein (TIGR03803 family)